MISSHTVRGIYDVLYYSCVIVPSRDTIGKVNGGVEIGSSKMTERLLDLFNMSIISDVILLRNLQDEISGIIVI